MKISRNLAVFGAVGLALLAGSAFASVDDRPSVATHAALNQYQRSSQPYYVTADNAAMFASRHAPYQRSGIEAYTAAERAAALAATSLYQRASQPFYVMPDSAAAFASTSQHRTFVHPYDGLTAGAE